VSTEFTGNGTEVAEGSSGAASAGRGGQFRGSQMMIGMIRLLLAW
jgi:hypothetical protein